MGGSTTLMSASAAVTAAVSKSTPLPALSSPRSGQWDRQRIAHLAAALRRRVYADGDVIWRQGDAAGHILLVREGSVALQREVEVTKNMRWPINARQWEVEETTSVVSLTLGFVKPGLYTGVEAALPAQRQHVRDFTVVACGGGRRALWNGDSTSHDEDAQRHGLLGLTNPAQEAMDITVVYELPLKYFKKGELDLLCETLINHRKAAAKTVQRLLAEKYHLSNKLHPFPVVDWSAPTTAAATLAAKHADGTSEVTVTGAADVKSSSVAPLSPSPLPKAQTDADKGAMFVAGAMSSREKAVALRRARRGSNATAGSSNDSVVPATSHVHFCRGGADATFERSHPLKLEATHTHEQRVQARHSVNGGIGTIAETYDGINEGNDGGDSDDDSDNGYRRRRRSLSMATESIASAAADVVADEQRALAAAAAHGAFTPHADTLTPVPAFARALSVVPMLQDDDDADEDNNAIDQNGDDGVANGSNGASGTDDGNGSGGERSGDDSGCSDTGAGKKHSPSWRARKHEKSLLHARDRIGAERRKKDKSRMSLVISAPHC